MPKPLKKLGELFGVSPSYSQEREASPPFKVKSWEELISIVNPLKEKNFYFKLSPTKPHFYEEKTWPPQKLEVKLPLTSEYIEGKNHG